MLYRVKVIKFPCICIVEGQPYNVQIATFKISYVFDQFIQYSEGLMKTFTSIDALKFRLLWATYQYVYKNIRVTKGP